MKFSKAMRATWAKQSVPAVLLGMLIPLAAQAQNTWQENEIQPPAAINRSQLIPFDMSIRTELQFSVDASSVSVGSDRVVRYVMLARSSGGTENILYEGLRCETAEARNYARWNQAEQRWVPSSVSKPWRALSGVAASLPAARLAYLAFCDGPSPAEPKERMLSDLRRGGKNIDQR